MPENRQYAGPHIAADLQVADGVYVTVLHHELSDEQAGELGYTLDAETAPTSGLIFARRSVTISDELAALLDAETWPRIGGTASAENIVDDPTSNPATAQTYELADGTEVTAVELNERSAIEALGEEAANRAVEELDPAASLGAQRAALNASLSTLDSRTESLKTALETENITDGDRADIEAELDELAAERDGILKAIGELK